MESFVNVRVIVGFILLPWSNTACCHQDRLLFSVYCIMSPFSTWQGSGETVLMVSCTVVVFNCLCFRPIKKYMWPWFRHDFQNIMSCQTLVPKVTINAFLWTLHKTCPCWCSVCVNQTPAVTPFQNCSCIAEWIEARELSFFLFGGEVGWMDGRNETSKSKSRWNVM